MQDLGSTELNKITYTIETLGVSGSVTDTINPSFSDHVGTYAKNNISVKSGFNKITLSIPEKDGGITSTFLMIPGRTVTITGSVYPSDFVDSPIEVKVIDLKDASLTVKDSAGTKNKEEVAVEEGNPNSQKVNMYVLTKGTDYTFDFVDDDDYTDFFVEHGEVTRKYQWYVGSSDITGATSETVTSTSLGIKDKSGDFSITCVTTYEFVKDGVTYKIEASATEGKVRVK